MEQIYNVKDKRITKKLISSKRFPKYHDMFLSNTCFVQVNSDDFLIKDEFIIFSKSKVLPKKIYLYGKKTNKNNNENNIYLNSWMPIFLKTVEQGNLCKFDFSKSTSKLELTIGLPLTYRRLAFKGNYWTKSNVIRFLECLFNIELSETEYIQQNLLDEFLNAA